MSRIKIALQKSGRLSEESFDLLSQCGIKIAKGDRKLFASSNNFPLDVLFLRDDDIPEYVEKGIADIGIVGENVVWETTNTPQIIKHLGFGKCRLSLAVGKEEDYQGIDYFSGGCIATSYPKTLKKFLAKSKISADIEYIKGSVEIAVGIGLAQGIFDIVSTGSTLMMNGLKEVEVLARSEAVLIKNASLDAETANILDQLIFRIESVLSAKSHKYIMLNAPLDCVEQISALLPGIKSPTIVPLVENGWCSIHSVIAEDEFWEIIDSLRIIGAKGILVLPIEKMVS